MPSLPEMLNVFVPSAGYCHENGGLPCAGPGPGLPWGSQRPDPDRSGPDGVLEPEVFAHFSGMRLAVVVARDVDTRVDRPAVAEAWARAWSATGTAVAAHGNAQSHPRVLGAGLSRNFGATVRRFVVEAAAPRISG